MSSGLDVHVRSTGRDVDLALHVEPGQTVAVLGPNGAGKSTVLAAIAGTLRPDETTVELDGRVLARTRTGTWVPPHRRGVALLAQDPLLFPHLDARDNVAFGPRSTGASRSEARATAEHWLGAVGARDLAGRRPAALSGGQAQRVAVARALATDPRLLLLDEPMAALDVGVAPAVRRLLREVLAERTAVVVTHDVLDALALADRVVVVEDGGVAESGPTHDVLARPRSTFGAQVAGLDLVRGVVRDGHVVTGAGHVVSGVAQEPLREGTAAVAVFSPSAVAVHLRAPGGSPRNVLPAVVTHVEAHGDRVRVRTDVVDAEVTLAAAAELELTPGRHVHLVVKATEVAVHPA